MIKEISCGAVIYKLKDNKHSFLLVYSNRNSQWSFPKGHMESAESEIETARREILEETGIENLKFIDDFRDEIVYEIDAVGAAPCRPPNKKIEKHSIFFLACSLDDNETHPQDNEIGKTQWLSFEEALKTLKFDSHRQVLKNACKKLGG